MNHKTREIQLIWLPSTNQGLLPGAEDEVGLSWHHDFAVEAEDLNTVWILLQGRIRQVWLVRSQYHQVTGFFRHLLQWKPSDLSSKNLSKSPICWCPLLCPLSLWVYSFITILIGFMKGKVKNVCSVSFRVWKPPASVSQTGSCIAPVCIAYSERAVSSVLTNERA